MASCWSATSDPRRWAGESCNEKQSTGSAHTTHKQSEKTPSTHLGNVHRNDVSQGTDRQASDSPAAKEIALASGASLQGPTQEEQNEMKGDAPLAAELVAEGPVDE